MTINRAKSAADRIITRHGGEAALVRETDPPVNPWDDPGGVVILPVQLIETGFEEDYLISGSVVAGDVMVLLRSDVAPAMADKLRLRGRDMTIIEIKPVQPSPDGAAVHFAVHARA